MSKKTYHHGNLREALIEASNRIISTEGVEGLSLRKVARDADVSAPALYSHFSDKRELLASLATRGFEQLSAAMVSAARDREDASNADNAKLIGLAIAYIGFARQNVALFQLMFGREVGNLLDFPALVEAGSKCYALMADCVAEQVAACQPRLNTAIAATAAWSTVHGLATLLNDGRVSVGSCGVASTEDLVTQVCGTLAFTRSAQ